MLKEYFSLSKNERNGFFICVIIIIVLLLYIDLSYRFFSPEVADLSQLQDSVMSFYAVKSPIEDALKVQTGKSAKPKYYLQTKKQKSIPKIVCVELNMASVDELITINGVGEYYAKKIVGLRNRLGGFSSKEQLLSIEGMTAKNYSSIEKQTSLDTSLVLEKIEINQASFYQLSKIYGLDSSSISSLVKYRDRLGGYYRLGQLKEVYGLSDYKYDILTNRVIIDSSLIKSLDINHSTFKEVLRHPYIGGYDNTKAIFRYLEYGDIKSWDEFKSIPQLNLEQSDMLRLYLSFITTTTK